MSDFNDELEPEENEASEVMPIPGIGRAVELTVQIKTAGMRLDQYLVLQFPDFSRSIIQKAIEADSVTINDLPIKRSTRVKQGDRVRIWLPEPNRPEPTPENIPLDILYEDEFLAVVNKPYDMVVHPARGNWTGTLVNALAFHFKDHLSKINGDYRPGIVHRLDRDTSGVILVAKEEQTHRDLGMQFETRKIFKEYVAIASGVLDRDSDYIERRIGHHPHDRIKMIVTDDEEKGKEACTYYEVKERFRGYTFVRMQPRTGRTHQLRVHLASIGHAILADKVYSGRDEFRMSDLTPALAGTQNDEILLPRQALHAQRLRFVHPRTKEVVAVEAPLPPEFVRTLEVLRRHRSER
ncbi:MAG: RluA family pseudouridine synthase [Planctomycetes bacterium]|nr:RluA family pseudouridine synthase [Planctomycetota bacterium]